MPNETFRQERSPQQNKDALEMIQALQKTANSPDTGMPKISGQIPTKIQEMMGNTPIASNHIPSDMQGVMQNSKLQELIDGARIFTQKYERIALPSLGRFYNGNDGPVDGVLHIRPMSGDEQDMLSNTRITKSGDWLRNIFSKCIREKYVTDNFLVEDRHYLLIFLRGISFGPDYEAEIACSSCGEKFPTVIDLDADVKLTMCPDEFNAENLNDVLPTTGYKFTYRFPKISDDSAVTNRKTKGYQEFGSNFSSDNVTFRMSLFVQDVEGVKDQRSIQALLKQLPVNDLNYLQEVINNPPFGVDTELKIDCPYCFSEVVTEMPMSINFFYPTAKRKKQE